MYELKTTEKKIQQHMSEMLDRLYRQMPPMPYARFKELDDTLKGDIRACGQETYRQTGRLLIKQMQIRKVINPRKTDFSELGMWPNDEQYNI
jgi:hypothetical protein